MSEIYYHSDWHLGHEFVARDRGYETAAEHDGFLLDAVNATVTKRDHLWILGDLTIGSLTRALAQVKQVNGTKHLVLGNHDAAHPRHRKSSAQMKRYYEAFDSVHLHEMHRIDGRDVLLSHFPYEGDHKPEDRDTQWRLRDEGLWLLHGHVHKEWPVRGRQINVGADWNRLPYNRDEIAAIINQGEQ